MGWDWLPEMLLCPVRCHVILPDGVLLTSRLQALQWCVGALRSIFDCGRLVPCLDTILLEVARRAADLWLTISGQLCCATHAPAAPTRTWWYMLGKKVATHMLPHFARADE